MLDRNLVAREPEAVREALRRRQAPDEVISSLDRFIAVLTKRRELQGETDELRAERNRTTQQIGPLMKAGRRDEAAPLREQVKAIGERLDAVALATLKEATRLGHGTPVHGVEDAEDDPEQNDDAGQAERAPA